jgi:hypothetical protein
MESLSQLNVHNVIVTANNGIPVSAKRSQCNCYCKQWIHCFNKKFTIYLLQRPIPAKCGLIWFSGFKEEDLNVKVYDVRQTDAQKHILCREPPNKHSYQIWF